jgi:hypothetical protein
MQKQIWIDTRLTEEEMNFLWSAISEENKVDLSRELAGNIFKSEQLFDKDNWFYETVLKELSEKLFYRDWDNYHEYYIEKKKSLPKFEMNFFWVNYQRQHEFNPLHNHNGDYSFVIFMKIPTHWKDQHALPISANSNIPVASDFVITQPDPKDKICVNTNFPLSPEDEGRMLFFPALLQHMVYPFYGTEEERITISGNIRLCNSNKPKGEHEMFSPRNNTYEEKENILKTLENSVIIMKEELKRSKENK